MPDLDKPDHMLLTIYGDNKTKDITKILETLVSGKDLRVLTPDTQETLEQAAQNSSLIIIGISGPDDPNFLLCRRLRDNRMVVADIVACSVSAEKIPPVKIMANGFDGCFTVPDTEIPEFKKYLMKKMSVGSQRLSGLIQEEEYRRVCDALSSAPTSMIIFDADKRAVFVSDHYFRAYPKIAPRLTRGLSVYEAFAMMAKEDGIESQDKRYSELEKFWYNLEGSVEFTLNDGMSYQLKAVRLPNRRGTVVTAQNISDYHHRNAELADKTVQLQAELENMRTREVEERALLQNILEALNARQDDDLKAIIEKLEHFLQDSL